MKNISYLKYKIYFNKLKTEYEKILKIYNDNFLNSDDDAYPLIRRVKNNFYQEIPEYLRSESNNLLPNLGDTKWVKLYETWYKDWINFEREGFNGKQVVVANIIRGDFNEKKYYYFIEIIINGISTVHKSLNKKGERYEIAVLPYFYIFKYLKNYNLLELFETINYMYFHKEDKFILHNEVKTILKDPYFILPYMYFVVFLIDIHNDNKIEKYQKKKIIKYKYKQLYFYIKKQLLKKKGYPNKGDMVNMYLWIFFLKDTKKILNQYIPYKKHVSHLRKLCFLLINYIIKLYKIETEMKKKSKEEYNIYDDDIDIDKLSYQENGLERFYMTVNQNKFIEIINLK